jgi:hypothetical protein
MAELESGKPVSLQELMVSTLAMTDALTKLLIEKGVITDAEFKQKLLDERAVYQRISESDNAIITSSYQQRDRLQYSNTAQGRLIEDEKQMVYSAAARM